MVRDLANAGASIVTGKDGVRPLQLIGDDDDVVVRRRNRAGFPVRRVAPHSGAESPVVVAIQTTAGASVPVIVTMTFWVEVASCESVTVTV